MRAAVAVTPENETYTFKELDEVVGATLYVGRLHNAIATFLDVTHYEEDPELLEFLNLLPAEMVMELLPATTVLLAEVKARIDGLIAAIDVALDSTVERVVAESPVSEVDEEFAKIIHVEFGKDRNK